MSEKNALLGTGDNPSLVCIMKVLNLSELKVTLHYPKNLNRATEMLSKRGFDCRQPFSKFGSFKTFRSCGQINMHSFTLLVLENF